MVHNLLTKPAIFLGPGNRGIDGICKSARWWNVRPRQHPESVRSGGFGDVWHLFFFVGFGYQQIAQGSLNIIKLPMFFGWIKVHANLWSF